LSTPYFDDEKSIGPAELGLLQEVLVDLCRATDIDPHSSDGTKLASSLIGLFKCGFRSRQELLFMMQDRPLTD